MNNLASMIDHTILKPATVAEITTLCQEAMHYNFASVCVNPCYVKLCATLLKDSQVKVCTVVGFPLGDTSTASKVAETRQAIADGATEIDMVLNQSYAKMNDWQSAEDDITAVVDSAEGVLVKVILETCNLSDEQIVKACNASINGGALFVKTSTGFGSGGAKAEHIALMHNAVKDAGLYVKASGGVRTYEDAALMVSNGASRIGTSNGIAIVTGAEAKNNY